MEATIERTDLSTDDKHAALAGEISRLHSLIARHTASLDKPEAWYLENDRYTATDWNAMEQNIITKYRYVLAVLQKEQTSL